MVGWSVSAVNDRNLAPVEDELRAFLRCGVLGHGFARVRCTGCETRARWDHLENFIATGG